MKWNPAEGKCLVSLQQAHMTAFQAAYDAALTRPKAHYALHVWRQVLRWGRHADCFVGERKHRIFKSQVAPKMTNLNTFSKSCLLQLTQMELLDAEDMEAYTGRLLGKLRADPACAQVVGLPKDSKFSTEIEYHCVKYAKNNFLILSNDCCVKVQGAVSNDVSMFLLVTSLSKATNSHSKLPQWKCDDNSKLALLPLSRTVGHEPMYLIRESKWHLCLLR